MKKTLYFFFGLVLCHAVKAQDSISKRIIFIGDAGEIDKEQQAILPAASNLILKDRTTVIYLGDNIYPKGMGLPGSRDQEETKLILQSQYKPMRSNGASAYFIPRIMTGTGKAKMARQNKATMGLAGRTVRFS